MPDELRMNMIGGRASRGPTRIYGVPMSCFVSRCRVAILLAASAMASPALAQEQSRDMQDFFRGNLIASGEFKNLHDGSTRSVRVRIHGGVIGGGAFQLVEDSVFSDGERLHKVWRFTKVGEGRFVGSRADLIGQATVEAYGNKIVTSYSAHTPTKGGAVYDLDFKEIFVLTQPRAGDFHLAVSYSSTPVGEAHLTVRNQQRRLHPVQAASIERN